MVLDSERFRISFWFKKKQIKKLYNFNKNRLILLKFGLILQNIV